jgi:superfamily II DNA or RNA helicase
MEDRPTETFYIPSLKESIFYSRAVGYFSSAIISVLAEAFTDFTERGGKMRLICSPVLTPADAQLFETLSNNEILDLLNTSITRLDQDGLINEPLSLMAFLVKKGTLEIKFAVPYNRKEKGIFHQKIGIFSDGKDKVAFIGSNNESISGWLEMNNAESFSVNCSWKESENSRVEDLDMKFEKMWNNNYIGFNILNYSDSLEFIQKRKVEDYNLLELKKDAIKWYRDRLSNDGSIEGDWLRHYQRQAVDNWISNESGVISFATGAGKTITAAGVIEQWRKTYSKRSVLILVPSVELQKQWKRVLNNLPFLKNVNILLVGGEGIPDNWRVLLKDYSSNKEHNLDGIIIAVNNSAALEGFIERVHWGRHLLVIADEMHKLGADSYTDLLNAIKGCRGRLGLSATPKRYDSSETDFLYEVFGEELKPVVDITYAQHLGVLVNYRYNYETVMLTEEEELRYTKLTNLMMIKMKNNEEDSDISLLRIKRARILKNAEVKIDIAAEILLKNYKVGEHWLVFCDNKDQLMKIHSKIKDLKPQVLHSGIKGSKDETLLYFENNGGILLTIHMFDEGLDMPEIDNCLIVASSQSKREFIQRRGRVLRANSKKPKPFATIWDILVVDQNGKAFNNAEIERSTEFANSALNKHIIRQLSLLANNNNYDRGEHN